MLSSGGTAPAAEAARAGRLERALGPRRRRRRGRPDWRGSPASGDGARLRHGRDLVRRLRGRGRRASGAGRVAADRRPRPIQLPMVDVHTVGAGGGSIGWRDPGGALRVGPALGGRRARAGLLRARRRRSPRSPTPTWCSAISTAASELAGGVALDAEAAQAAVAAPRGRARPRAARRRPRGSSGSPNQEMVRALRVVTVERGIDPRGFALLPFGGAGPMHAAAIAEELGIARIVCPRASGVLSALGLLASERRRDTARTVMLSGERLTARARRGRGRGAARAARRGPRRGRASETVYELRYRGQAFELPVAGPQRPDPARLAERLRRRARAPLRLPRPRGRDRAGLRSGSRWSTPGSSRARARRPRAGSSGRAAGRASTAPGSTATVLRGEPAAGLEAEGPCVFELPEATLVLPPGWRASVDGSGTIVAERGR